MARTRSPEEQDVSQTEFRLTIPRCLRVEVKENYVSADGKPPMTILAVYTTGGKVLSFALHAADLAKYGPVRIFKVTELSDPDSLHNR